MIPEEIQKKIEAVEKEISDTPYDKSSQFHHGVLKAKLSKLKEGVILNRTIQLIIIPK